MKYTAKNDEVERYPPPPPLKMQFVYYLSLDTIVRVSWMSLLSDASPFNAIPHRRRSVALLIETTQTVSQSLFPFPSSSPTLNLITIGVGPMADENVNE